MINTLSLQLSFGAWDHYSLESLEIRNRKSTWPVFSFLPVLTLWRAGSWASTRSQLRLCPPPSFSGPRTGQPHSLTFCDKAVHRLSVKACIIRVSMIDNPLSKRRSYRNRGKTTVKEPGEGLRSTQPDSNAEKSVTRNGDYQTLTKHGFHRPSLGVVLPPPPGP